MHHPMNKKHVGGKFEDFLAEEGTLRKSSAIAAKRAKAWRLKGKEPALKKSKSVWDALGGSREEAANMKVRAELMISLQERVKRQAGSQAEKAGKLGLSQPRLNDLLRGRINKFSLDALVNIASRAGLRVNLHVRKAA